MQEHEVYSAIGEQGFERLIANFYKQIPHDEVLGPMYAPDDLPGAEQRLREFLIFRFGGPQRYLETRGHPRLRMRHAPFAVTTEAREHWLRMMDAALSMSALPQEAESLLRAYFESTASAMINRMAPV